VETFPARQVCPPIRTRSEVLIVGGGLAGAAAAITLARAGREVTLLEREREPRDKVCGEFLSHEALALLRALDVSPEALGAIPIHRVQLASRRTRVEAGLPFRAVSLTRRVLDAALLEAASRNGVHVHRGLTAESLTHTHGCWQVTSSTGDLLSAPDLILATGKHDLRGFPRPKGTQNDLVALKMYLQLAPAQAAQLEGRVELLLHSGGYTGLQLAPARPGEAPTANLCALIQRSVLARLNGKWEAVFALIQQGSDHARERLTGATPLLPKPLAAAAIPYGFVRSRLLADHLWAVGDQAAVIPSFTGDGMSIALYTGLRAAHALLAGQGTAAFQHQLCHDLRAQVTRATAISRALVHPGMRPLAVATAHLYPPALTLVARFTRIADPAIASLHPAPAI
jgi:flavin-dependent dehydrogenase